MAKHEHFIRLSIDEDTFDAFLATEGFANEDALAGWLAPHVRHALESATKLEFVGQIGCTTCGLGSTVSAKFGLEPIADPSWGDIRDIAIQSVTKVAMILANPPPTRLAIMVEIGPARLSLGDWIRGLFSRN